MSNERVADNFGLLTIKSGLDSNQDKQLITYTNMDSLVQRYTSDKNRFENQQSFDQWLNKGRAIYTMSDEEKLLGIIWFGAKAFPENKLTSILQLPNHQKYGITFAVRIYEDARGKSLSGKFMRCAWVAYEKSQDFLSIENNDFWLESSADNISAVHTYHNFGFKQITTPDKHNKILMVRESLNKLRYISDN